MNLTIYITRDYDGHDSHDICVTYDRAAADKAALDHYAHLTRSERRTREIWVDAFAVQAPDDGPQDAEAIYYALVLEDDPSVLDPVEHDTVEELWAAQAAAHGTRRYDLAAQADKLPAVDLPASAARWELEDLARKAAVPLADILALYAPRTMEEHF